MIKQRKREDLYDLFRQGAIPSGADFADLIKSQLNILDDGIEISEDDNDPIGFKAHGKTENYLDLNNTKGERKWRISGFDEAITTEGLNITANGQSKLFMEWENGDVGINTDSPKAKLHIIQISAADVLRIDDKGNDTTPLIVNSEGQVGLGTDSPSAQLHLSYSGSGDILRVDDTDSDTTPLIINDAGNVGIGYGDPQAKVTVAGGMSVGKNYNPGSNNLYVAGNIEVAGTVVFSNGSGVGGIEINAPLTSKTPDLTFKDNVVITGDTTQTGSHGNLSVAGDTTLGTYQKVYENQNVLTVNGRIRAGADLKSGMEQYALELNDIFTVDRTPDNPQATLKGGLTVNGSVTLGDSPVDIIYLNGTVRRGGELGVTIDDDLTVSKTSSLYDVIISNSLKVSNTTSLYDATIGNSLTVSKSSSLYDVTVGNNLTVSNISNLNTAVIKSLTLQTGATVTKISTDNTLSGNSNSTIPTEKAVKEYVDRRISAIQTVYA